VAHRQIAGLIVSEYSAEYSHWNAVKSLSQWLSDSGRAHTASIPASASSSPFGHCIGIPALYGVDTRLLTKKIRETGTVLGKIEFEGQPVAIEDPNQRNLVAEVSVREIRSYGEGNSPHILAYDCGMKNNIIRYFVYEQGVRLTGEQPLCAHFVASP